MNAPSIDRLSIDGAWVVTPSRFGDDRGEFLESFRADLLEPHIGHRLDVVQTNTSISAAGVVRGIHFADVPPGQAKYVTCVAGSVLDVVVDIRLGSPTFGLTASAILDDVDRRAVYVAEGLGHAFMSMADGSAVTYLCSAAYAPGREHGIDPLDPGLNIDWPIIDRTGRPISPILSEKDRSAPTLAEAARSGLLPDYQSVIEFQRTLAR